MADAKSPGSEEDAATGTPDGGADAPGAGDPEPGDEAGGDEDGGRAAQDAPSEDPDDPDDEEKVVRPEDLTPVEILIERALAAHPTNRGYVVDPNYIPALRDRTGSFRSDNVGRHDYSIADLAPAFDVARRRSLLTASRAINPADTGVADNQITLAPGSPPLQDVEDRIQDKLEPELEHLTTADVLSVPTNRDSSIQPEPGARSHEEPMQYNQEPPSGS